MAAATSCLVRQEVFGEGLGPSAGLWGEVGEGLAAVRVGVARPIHPHLL